MATEEALKKLKKETESVLKKHEGLAKRAEELLLPILKKAEKGGKK